MEGAQRVVDLLKEFEEINNKFGEPMSDDEMNKLIERQGQVQDAIDAAGDGSSTTKSRSPWMRCAVRIRKRMWPTCRAVRNVVSRFVVCCCKSRMCCCSTNRPTTSTRNRSSGWSNTSKQYAGTVIAVTHDRYFLDNVAGWILELDRGEGIPWKGNYSSWLEQKSNRLAQEEKTESKRRKTLERELEWVRMSPKGRHAKSKARIAAYDRLLNEDVKEREDKLELFIPPGPRLGSVVYEFENVTKSYGDRVLFENLSFSLPPAGVVGVIGPNGAGKTTLFKLLMGLEQPDSGTIRRGDTVQVAYVDQTHDDLVPGKTVLRSSPAEPKRWS